MVKSTYPIYFESMKLEKVRGCICDCLDADGEREIDFSDHKRRAVINKIADYLKKQDDGCNALMSWFIEWYGDWKDLGYCEECGDVITEWTIEI